MSQHVAIITRTKNRNILLRRAMRSVLDQTYADWTHVIVNDGGDTAPVDALAEEFAPQYGARLRIVHNTECLGVARAANIGIESCASDYILIHDDDDSLVSTYLEKTVAYLSDPPFPTIQAVVSLIIQVEERLDGSQITKISEKATRSMTACVLIADIAEMNPIPPISFLFKRSAYNEVGQFDPALPLAEDWDFLLRFILKFDVGVIQEFLASYHIRRSTDGDLSNTVVKWVDRHVLYEKIIRNRIFRDTNNPHLASLIQKTTASYQLLRRLYDHPVIGTVIRLWSLVNSRIPRLP